MVGVAGQVAGTTVGQDAGRQGAGRTQDAGRQDAGRTQAEPRLETFSSGELDWKNKIKTK